MGLEDIRYWWEDLELRKKLEENQSIVILILLGIILFAVGLVSCQLLGGRQGSSSQETKLVYFDLTNQTIKIVEFEYPGFPASPLEGTDDVFMARVFSCEELPPGTLKDGMTLDDLKAEGMFVAWLERIDPEMTEDMAMFGEGQAYRTIKNDRWYKTTESGYEMIMKQLRDRCQRAYSCAP